jgi:hypothetical protein
MTNQVVLANELRNRIVEVDADDPRSAHEIAGGSTGRSGRTASTSSEMAPGGLPLADGELRRVN